MVKVCSLTHYSDNDFSKYKLHFEKFNFPLHIFQKYAIEGILEGQHVLVTAPTGSGKSLPAEFALDYFHSIGKKTIYCSPIKALSNQKFYDFTQKYPHISIGLITGDIKTNPDADVLIMTTEILLNKLYQIKSTSHQINSSVSFDMDLENELGCVIFDEIHMINDKDRGHVWENCIMLLPSHIQMVGLSATLDNPEKFAFWLENRGNKLMEKVEKQVYLTKKMVRAVPLTHYSFIASTQSVFKHIKDKALEKEINDVSNKLFIIQDANGKFNEPHYDRMNKILKVYDQKNVRIRRSHVLNQVSKLLVEKEMTPAICYVFSRKQIEVCACELTTKLLDSESQVPYIVKNECDKMIRKLPNFEEYANLPDYINLVSLLEKGIGIHHSGMMPILREIVELLFSKGYIKLLFCTESVAIGLNLPVKTTIFTDINKHDGSTFRILYGHEFVQSSGRAGRLGIDTVGNVIHLHNLFRNMDKTNYKTMMAGKPQALVSKFKISFNLILNLIDIGDNQFNEFANKSMITGNIDDELAALHTMLTMEIAELEIMNQSIKYMNSPPGIIQQYIDFNIEKKNVVNKKRKLFEKKINDIEVEYKNIKKDVENYKKISEKQKKVCELENHIKNVNNYINSEIKVIQDFLLDETFIEKDADNKYKLTLIGLVGSHLREVHCMVFARLIIDKHIDKLNVIELVQIFSCLTNCTVDEDNKDIFPRIKDGNCKSVITLMKTMYEQYQEKESKNQMNSGIDYAIHYDLVNYVERWCNCNSVMECKQIIHSLMNEKNIFLGEFVKAILKINNISSELQKIAELINNIELLSKLKQIEEITMKFVVTNQSLYI
jgi:superfamily II RNA helicase